MLHGLWPFGVQECSRVPRRPVEPKHIIPGRAFCSGPGFPGRGIGGDPAYESEFNFEKIERLNRQLKLSAGSGFRSDMRKYSRPWITTDVRSRSSDIMAVYKEVEQTASARPIVSKASLLASRPAHSAPFISSGMYH